MNFVVSRRAMIAVGGCALSALTGAVGWAREEGRDGGPAALLPTDFDYAAGSVDAFTVQGPSGLYTIYVAHPKAPPPPSGYPVLWMLDGDAYFGTAVDALRLQAEYPRVSGVNPMIVVAIGYPGARPFDMRRRSLDFLPHPTSTSPKVRESLPDPDSKGEPRKYLATGGADDFARWLSTDLRSAIAIRYRVDPEAHDLTGHSLGGAFCAYILGNHPTMFRRYALQSPSFWWDEQRIVRELAALDETRLQAGFRALITIARTEIPGNAEISKVMLEDARTAYKALSAKPGLRDKIRLIELQEENHQSSHVTAMSAILRWASA